MLVGIITTVSVMCWKDQMIFYHIVEILVPGISISYEQEELDKQSDTKCDSQCLDLNIPSLVSNEVANLMDELCEMNKAVCEGFERRFEAVEGNI